MVNECRTEGPMSSSRAKLERRTEVTPAVPLDAEGTIMPAIPPGLYFLFEEKPLLTGESAEHYDVLVVTTLHQVKPKDAIEALWAKDIIDLVWEAKRLRRWRGQILDQARLDAAAALILPVLRDRVDPMGLDYQVEANANALVMRWLRDEKGSTADVERLLRSRGATLSDVTAGAFQIALTDIERIDRMIGAADARRDKLLHEIKRKRTSLGHQLRAAATEVIDAVPSPYGAPPLQQG